MHYEVKEIQSKEIWEEFVLCQNPKSFLQSWNWGESHRVMGDKIFRFGYYNKSKLVGTCLVIKQKARRGPHFLIPGGPLIDWHNKQLVASFLGHIKKLARDEKVWFVRVRPELEDSPVNRKLFTSLGFIFAPMHLHAENTWILDTTKTSEDILAGMRKNTRYIVKKSTGFGLTITDTLDEKSTQILSNLQKETVERHGFVGFSDRLFKAQLATFGKDNQARLYIVWKKKVPLVAAIIIYYGNYGYYHHSGSTTKFQQIPSSYFLQWNVIQEVKKRNLKGYNFWGIAPLGRKKHRFAGVTTFKTGFGGERIDWLHAHDLPVSRNYYLTFVFETARKLLRGL
ncbi:peptidoglycan bridge formation glycyltransferase FemA/FemB family protein [Candidatus Woesebacteria bacterium]|nr:MAG: peptidoglycan bridge formation glycyltransferase FemA/FemB family protein [Candidatus Woesebacteria bacterium]